MSCANLLAEDATKAGSCGKDFSFVCRKRHDSAIDNFYGVVETNWLCTCCCRQTSCQVTSTHQIGFPQCQLDSFYMVDLTSETSGTGSTVRCEAHVPCMELTVGSLEQHAQLVLGREINTWGQGALLISRPRIRFAC